MSLTMRRLHTLKKIRFVKRNRNTIKKPALHIYEKYGFKEIKLENYEYIRGDIAFEYKVKRVKQ